MPEKLTLSADPNPAHVLEAAWDECWAIVNLRGDPASPAFCQGVARVLGLSLPLAACSAEIGVRQRIVWVGPDEWVLLSRECSAATLMQNLQQELAGLHFAVTDVSSNYTVLHLHGTAARELLLQGCPLDLHPRKFKTGQSAGSVFFKASI